MENKSPTKGKARSEHSQPTPREANAEMNKNYLDAKRWESHYSESYFD